MAFMIWNDQLSVGVRVIDDDHRKMICMINDLYEAILAGDASERLEGIIDGLVVYTRIHFAREERFFRQVNYPDAIEHKKEHDLFTRRVIELDARSRRSGENLSLEVMVLLKDWLFEHILGADKRFGPFFNEMGIH